MEVEQPSTDNSFDDVNQNYFENSNYSASNGRNNSNMLHQLAQDHHANGWNNSSLSPGQQPISDFDPQVAAYANRQGFRMDQFSSNCSHSLPHNFRSNMIGQLNHSQGS